jgi:CRISPR/Cas system-associated exonuclease Cas4 (RecB family)
MLLHALIERFVRHSAEERAEVFRPRRTLHEEIASWEKKNASNPRIESKVLAGQLRVEEILSAFAEARTHVTPLARRSSGASRWAQGAEVSLRDPQSKLRGRADWIAAGEIVDFKSGDRQNHHTEQLAFYGALYLAVTGQRPAALRLIYTKSNEVQKMPVPTAKEFELLLAKLRHQAALADQQVTNGEFPAKPEFAKCMYCHVRGLCDAYWKKLKEHNEGGIIDEASLVDYSPGAIATIEPAALGIYIRDSWSGLPSVLHLPQQLIDKAGDAVRRPRILALRASRTLETVRFSITQSSEIYIICDIGAHGKHMNQSIRFDRQFPA